ncbi:unnamed protein product [Cunninghamella blakesleeana]
MDPSINSDSNCVSEEKYNLVKKRLKEMTNKNEVLTSDLTQARKRLRRLTKEKSLLLDKISQYDDDSTNTPDDDSVNSVDDDRNNESKPIKMEEDNNRQTEPLKKDLHILMNDEDEIHHNNNNSNDNMNNNDNKNGNDRHYYHHESSSLLLSSTTHHSSIYKGVIKQEKPPDSMLMNPNTPVPSTIAKNASLPTLPSTILKHAIPPPSINNNPPPPLHHPQPYHHHHHHHPSHPHYHHHHHSLPPPNATSSPLVSGSKHSAPLIHTNESSFSPTELNKYSKTSPTSSPLSTSTTTTTSIVNNNNNNDNNNINMNNDNNINMNNDNNIHMNNDNNIHINNDNNIHINNDNNIHINNNNNNSNNNNNKNNNDNNNNSMNNSNNNNIPNSLQSTRSLTIRPPSITDTGKNCTMVPSSRPKRMRRGNQEPKMRRVQPLARDPTSGDYKLPVRVGILTVHSLGRVVPLTTYHNDRYIWPPGFKVSRTYLSMINANQNTVYTCTVEENGEQGPRFRVVADDCPDQPIIANSATGVWTAIVKRANEIRNREHSNSASGPDYYGFTHATIAKMIQDLPGADQCLNYVWQKFGVMHQRTAAGVAAAAQKKLANLEIMGSANKRAPPPLTDGFIIHKVQNESISTNSSSSSTSPPPSTSPSSSSSSPTSSVINTHNHNHNIHNNNINNNNTNNNNDNNNSTNNTSLQTLPSLSATSMPLSLPPPSTSLNIQNQLSSTSSSPRSKSSDNNTSTAILPSLETMTSTAAAAAAAVDIQQKEKLDQSHLSSSLHSHFSNTSPWSSISR